jgi:hypothetical protein
MTRRRYRITGGALSWTFERDGHKGAAYASQEAAFEAAVLDASNEMRAGNEVVIEVLRDPSGAGQMGTAAAQAR